MNATAVRIRNLETTLLMKKQQVIKLERELDAMRLANDNLQERCLENHDLIERLRHAGIIE